MRCRWCIGTASHEVQYRNGETDRACAAHAVMLLGGGKEIEVRETACVTPLLRKEDRP